MDLAARAVVVHGLEDACAALAAARELGVPVALWSAPGAGRYAGAGWFAALVAEAEVAEPGMTFTAVLDCGDDAGAASAALRSGIRCVRYAGTHTVRRKLEDIASRLGAEIVPRRPECFDPHSAREPASDLRVWLQRP
ncbi:MAG: hypothetical protein WD270_03795 [Acetobacterales bacterium]